MLRICGINLKEQTKANIFSSDLANDKINELRTANASIERGHYNQLEAIQRWPAMSRVTLNSDLSKIPFVYF